jgi:hypothetical protein
MLFLWTCHLVSLLVILWLKSLALARGGRKESLFSLHALALLPTENQIFMACLDAHLYEIEYTINALLVKCTICLYE